MKRCAACAVDIEGSWIRCPLCGATTEGEGVPDPMPAVPLVFSRRRVLAVLFFASLGVIVACARSGWAWSRSGWSS
jgi:hypothetical protein